MNNYKFLNDSLVIKVKSRVEVKKIIKNLVKLEPKNLGFLKRNPVENLNCKILNKYRVLLRNKIL
jgi:hypothetical protein